VIVLYVSLLLCTFTVSLYRCNQAYILEHEKTVVYDSLPFASVPLVWQTCQSAEPPYLPQRRRVNGTLYTLIHNDINRFKVWKGSDKNLLDFHLKMFRVFLELFLRLNVNI